MRGCDLMQPIRVCADRLCGPDDAVGDCFQGQAPNAVTCFIVLPVKHVNRRRASNARRRALVSLSISSIRTDAPHSADHLQKRP